MNKLDSLIEYFKSAKGHSPDNSVSDLNALTNVENLCTWLKENRTLYIKANIEYLREQIKIHIKTLRISALSLMEYNWNENSHSNILAYLIDYNVFEAGSQILTQIISNTENPNKDSLIKKVLKEKYSVTREYKIASGRLDLFIVDVDEKFAIIIENKIRAQIGKEYEEQEKIISVSQLEKYKKWCDENYPSYTTLFILLCFENEDENLFSFEKFTYETLYSCLKTINSSDNILEEYKLLLDSLINPKSHDLFKIKKLANGIIVDATVDISLTEFYNLKTTFYA
jgi:hypothetical protein